ncbi:MAG: hypothetical protein RSC76_10025 [Oscillospiraceae bacterium]
MIGQLALINALKGGCPIRVAAFWLLTGIEKKRRSYADIMWETAHFERLGLKLTWNTIFG